MRSNPILTAAIVLFLTGSAYAQPVPSREPASTHIFPAGGRRGTVVAVRVGGECLPPATGFRIWGDGVTAPSTLGQKVNPRYETSQRRDPTEIPISYPKEWQSQIEIAADAPLGAKFWRLSCARGGTGVRPFIVGELPEFIETEPNSDPTRAERITLPVTLNGQIAGERDMDYYRFSAQAGDVVVCDTLAARIGSPADPVIEIRDAQGQRMPAEEIRVAGDPVVAFRTPQSGDYLLIVSNVSFHGGPEHVYRMTVSTAPYVSFAFPPGGQAGQTRDIQLFALSGTGSPRVLTETVMFEAGRSGTFSVRGSAPGVNPVELVAGDLPDVVETEDNDSPSSAMPLTLAVTVHGQFLTAQDQDWFQFTAQEDQALTIRCTSFPATSSAMPVLALADAQGNVLAQANSADSADRECRIDWRAPQAGRYLIQLRDLQHAVRGGPDFIYCLTLREAKPDFALALKTDCVNVMQGGKTELEVSVRRLGGFESPVDLAIEGLPSGVRSEPAQIPANQSSTKMVLIAEDEALPSDARLRVVGKSASPGEMIERVAIVPHWRLDADRAGGAGVPPSESLNLTVQHKPVFRLFCSETYQYAHRGTIYPYRMQVERLGGFDGEIVLQLGDRQNRDLDGIEMLEVRIPPGATEAKIPIYLPESMHINIQSQSQLYVQGYAMFEDKWGQSQSLLVVSEKRCMVRPLPTVVKLKTTAEELVAKRGSTVRCELELDRTVNFKGACELELVEPTSEAGFVADKVQIGAGESSAVMTVHISESTVRQTDLALRFRATGKLSDDVTVVTEASLPVHFVE